jgi:hypothetical protein
VIIVPASTVDRFDPEKMTAACKICSRCCLQQNTVKLGVAQLTAKRGLIQRHLRTIRT